ncbi:MAG: ATP-binding protein [Ruminococcus sp.]|jgi:DNA replication protein DnaC|nr:ATP-binding protein [Ruminococcus sp.]
MSFSLTAYEKAEQQKRAQQNKAEFEAAEIYEEISARFPEIVKIDNEIKSACAEISKLLLTANADIDTVLEQIRQRVENAKQKRSRILMSAGLERDYLDVHYSCPKCYDKGLIGEKRCECFIKLIRKYSVEEINRSANLPNCDFEHFDISYYHGTDRASGIDISRHMNTLAASCKKYAENFTLDSPNLYFYGGTGIGKTHLSLSIAKAVALRGFIVAYASACNIVRDIVAETFNRGDTTKNTEDTLIHAELLIIDDLGAEMKTNPNESAMYNLINSRMNLNLPTIVSSNLNKSELEDRYEDRMISRILGNFDRKLFLGSDIRQMRKKKL